MALSTTWDVPHLELRHQVIESVVADEGTFSLCTFLHVDALARSGRLEDARLTFS